jgi:hypothetical protein
LASQCRHPTKETTKVITGGTVGCYDAEALLHGECICGIVDPLDKRPGRTMLRNDAMDRFMSVGACGWTEEAGVED